MHITSNVVVFFRISEKRGQEDVIIFQQKIISFVF